MIVNTIYPVTTADKVTKVSDPTNGGNQASLAEVLANMATKYASLDKTGEGARTSETWHKKDNHISFGGLQSSVDYDDKTALDLLKAVLSPEYYPYKEIKQMNVSKNKDDVFTWYNSNTHSESYIGGGYPNLSLNNSVHVFSYPSTGGYNTIDVGSYTLDGYNWSGSYRHDIDAYRITYSANPSASIVLNDNLYTSLGVETTDLAESKNNQNPTTNVDSLGTVSFSTKKYNITVRKPLVVYKDEQNRYVPCWWVNNNPTLKEVECKAIANALPIFYVLKDAVSVNKDNIKFYSKNELGGKVTWVETSNTHGTNILLKLKMSGDYMVEDPEGEQSNDQESDTLEYLKFTTDAPTDDKYWTEDVIIHATINK